jgi:uncharacterized protein YqeY
MHEKIKNQIKDAMRAHDAVRLEVLRSLSASFMNEVIAKGKAIGPSGLLSDADVTTIIRKSIKQHKDSIEQFTAGHRKDLVKKEQAELDILEAFLPKMMSADEVKKFVKGKLKGEKLDKAKIGQLTGQMMKELKGKADGSDVKAAIEGLLK